MVKLSLTGTFFKRTILSSLLVLIFLASKAQTILYQNSHYTYHNAVPNIVANPTTTINLPTGILLDRTVKNGLLKVKLDLGEDYKYGNLDFKFQVSFNINAYTGPNGGGAVYPGVFGSGTYSVVVDFNKPEGLFYKDFTSFAGNFTPHDFPFQSFRINNIVITDLAPGSSLSTAAKTKIKNDLRLVLDYDIEYGLNANTSGIQSPVINSFSNASSRVLSFTWSNNGIQFPNYQFQLLRLYNKSDVTSTNETIITTDLDWSKALTIETQSSATNLKLTMAEGTGFYVWRVRPIGSYFEGGIANHLNYGPFSANPDNAANVSLNSAVTPLGGFGSGANPYFFFADPDDDKNFIYSRIFTEQNKVSENITYANGLLQTKQAQKYLPSKDTTIITQSIQDHIGRPALTTMPVPVAGDLDTYKENFVQTPSGELYKAKDFDNNSNYTSPSPVKDNGTDFKYYSDNNTDKTVPGADGFPFTRTIFENDGTGRVKEQSGVGKTHMIGLEAEGMGKTVKTYYGTPSEDELVRIFGDEAPDNESVIKTVTVDQNKTASVSYMSKEGKVIATSLTFQETDNTGANGPFDPLENENSIQPTVVNDKVTTNVKTENGFISSKRLVLMQNTPMDLSYSIECLQLEGLCSTADVDCGYKVKLIVHSLDDIPNSVPVLEDKDLSVIACNGGFKQVSWPQFNLAPGTYLIEKKLIPSTAPSLQIKDATEKIEKQIRPLVSLITSQLRLVQDDVTLAAFHQFLIDLRNDIAAMTETAFVAKYSAAPNPAVPAIPLYNLDPNFELIRPGHSIALSPSSGIPQTAIVSSPCCILNVDVTYVPPFDCSLTPALTDKDGDGIIEVNSDYEDTHPGSTEYIPDFEGYAKSFLEECNINVYDYMNGWKTPGDFNLMVYHMLTDVYQVDAEPAKVQYKCEELAACWINQLVIIKDKLCGSQNFDAGTPPYKVSEGVDEESEGDEGTHDNHMDGEGDQAGGLLMKWIVKRALSKRMRDEQADGGSGAALQLTYDNHLVKEFLSCTGFKFALILDSYTPCPLQQDVDPAITYKIGNAPSATTCTAPAVTKYRPYRPHLKYNNLDHLPSGSDWKVLQVTAGITKDLFKNIKDPVYAFKYFEYKNDNSVVEFTTCYNDPNTNCLASDNFTRIPCCGGTMVAPTPCNFCDKGYIECPYTHEEWSSGQRFTFYELIRNQAQTSSTWNVLEVETCADYHEVVYNNDGVQRTRAQVEMDKMNAKCESKCESRRSEFKEALLKMLDEKCYVIGDCRTSDPATDHIIPEADLDVIVDKLVEQCQSQCDITTYKCQDQFCRSADAPKTFIGNDINSASLEFGVGPAPNCDGTGDCSASATFQRCEITKYKQAMGLPMQIDLPSKCPVDDPRHAHNPLGSKKFTCAPGNDPCNVTTTGNQSTLVPPDGTANFQQNIETSQGIGITITIPAE